MLQLIRTIKENSDYDIIIINDGSAPTYKPLFEKAVELGCKLLSHDSNRGKGAALKTAFTYLLETNTTDGFICADCDGQHAFHDIRQLAELLPKYPSSILLGCRKFIGKVPLKSKFGNSITRFVFSLITGNKISDTQTGLRGYSPKLLPWLVKLEGDRYEFEMKQLLEAKKGGYSLECIPIDTIYENDNKGSHFHPIRDSIRIYIPILKFSLSSISCGLLDFILLFILKYITENLLVSVMTARAISSLCNYLLNKHLVFRSKERRKTSSLLQYYLLAVVILVCNYLLLAFMNETLGLSLFVGKLLTEAILFIFSYTIQHKIIFRYKSNNDNS